MNGNKAYLYIDGVLVQSSTALATNPYYVAFGARGQGKSGYSAGGCSAGWDDIVWSQTENNVVLGLPENDDTKFIILDDIVNDAADGLYNTTSGSQQDANYMYGTFSRGNGTIANVTLDNQSINLIHYDTGTIYETQYTGTQWNNTNRWNIKTNIIDAGAPDGYYATTIEGSGAYSNFIVKKSIGATVNFDSSEYSIGDLATVSYDVSTEYWIASTYTYVVKIVDIYGNVKETETLLSRTGTIEYLFKEGDVSGVYYTVVQATPTTGGSSVWMGVDFATITEFGKITGYVTDQDGTAINGALLNFTQSSTVFTNATSDVDGSYTTVPFFITGTDLICNVTATGYSQHNYSVVPYSTSMKHINFTLPSLSLTYSGLGIGGVAMEGRLVGNSILNGYGNPISGVAVNVTNVSTGQSFTKYTNVAGWYLCDEGASCHLTHNVPYAIEGEKVGYTNSSIYTKIASGVL